MKISINLLPIEFRSEEIRRSKFAKVQTLGVVIILALIFLSSITVALRILQSQNISVVQNKLTQSEERVSGLKNTQASLFLLKNRLTTINQYLGTPSKQTRIYKIITKLLPISVSVSTISVDKSGDVLVLAIASDGNSLDDLITNLTTKEINEDAISKVSIENLNRGKDGIYRISLQIKTK